ncbi:hypothetical protein E2C01_002233 [Portunus trituberculatus]|uniref:Uncharacterized protein n=1 Tax=Portunus trituberculatus TaxID=210409 RepID=A0A5B7CJ73_PORTR|nr:hypothetical protein [Portunus trituberculatus]
MPNYKDKKNEMNKKARRRRRRRRIKRILHNKVVYPSVNISDVGGEDWGSYSQTLLCFTSTISEGFI